ncbi:MAG: hypothetical protein B7Z14_19060 [Bosea sp. 32-68-6]|nr:MAG: hypothetical protein B7Z14_19060 [Bosea sp. 32-68-6]
MPAGDSETLRSGRIEGGVGGDAQAASTRWRTLLVWMLRILSVLWLAKGLLAWAVIFGVWGEAQPPFENRLLSFQAIIWLAGAYLCAILAYFVATWAAENESA